MFTQDTQYKIWSAKITLDTTKKTLTTPTDKNGSLDYWTIKITDSDIRDLIADINECGYMHYSTINQVIYNNA